MLVTALAFPALAVAQVDYEGQPIQYHTAPTNDAVAKLAKRIKSGDATIRWDKKSGWLKPLLSALSVPESSQTLVFSKTSLQISRISAATPRAIYFSDDVYVGWVQNGGVIEVSAVDAKLGPVFYSIPQNQNQFQIKRDKGECMSCHATARTQNIPGYLVRSVFPGRDGTPFYGLGTTTTDHATPLGERFGGWYVTGTHGAMRHRGNAIANENKEPVINTDNGANRKTLSGLLNTTPYLADTSDMVALMVLEHQTQMHNFITRANYESRLAKHHDTSMSVLLERPANYVSESTRRRIASAGDKLLRYLLMKDAIELTSSIDGGSSFRDDFQSPANSDQSNSDQSNLGLANSAQGRRSLRELDLKNRLFKYPCSFLILSDSYAGLPSDVRGHVENRLAKILNNKDDTDEFDYLTNDDRAAIRKILSESLPGFRQRL